MELHGILGGGGGGAEGRLIYMTSCMVPCVGSLRKWGHTDLMQGPPAVQEDVSVYVCMPHPPPQIPALDVLHGNQCIEPLSFHQRS